MAEPKLSPGKVIKRIGDKFSARGKSGRVQSTERVLQYRQIFMPSSTFDHSANASKDAVTC